MLLEILKLALVNILNFEFCRGADVLLKFSLGWDSRDEIWSRFVFELVWFLVSRTQPPGQLCLWRCFLTPPKALLVIPTRDWPIHPTYSNKQIGNYLGATLDIHGTHLCWLLATWPRGYLNLTTRWQNGGKVETIGGSCNHFVTTFSYFYNNFGTMLWPPGNHLVTTCSPVNSILSFQYLSPVGSIWPLFISKLMSNVGWI